MDDVGGNPGRDPVPAGLRRHWQSSLGAGRAELSVLRGDAAPEGRPELVVVGAPRREQPGWDGSIQPVAGIVDPHGRAVVSVPPAHLVAVKQLARRTPTVDALRAVLPAALGRPDLGIYRATCRWGLHVPSASELPDVGAWVPATDCRLPPWLRPFGGMALIAWDGAGRFLAGIGLKRHDEHVHEIAVGTEEAARGRGVARRLVAQAARHLGAAGIVATYLHDPANAASARVADAAGFPDLGWTVLGTVVRSDPV